MNRWGASACGCGSSLAGAVGADSRAAHTARCTHEQADDQTHGADQEAAEKAEQRCADRHASAKIIRYTAGYQQLEANTERLRLGVRQRHRDIWGALQSAHTPS